MLAADISAAFANASRLGSKAGLILQALENPCRAGGPGVAGSAAAPGNAVLWTLVSAVALLLGGITGTAVVAAIFWDTPQRVLALVILAVIEFGVAAGEGMVRLLALAPVAAAGTLPRSTGERLRMSSGNLQSKPLLTTEARKRLLLVACTIDRLDLVASWRPRPDATHWLAQITSAPWFDLAASVSSRLLPRKFRVLARPGQHVGEGPRPLTSRRRIRPGPPRGFPVLEFS